MFKRLDRAIIDLKDREGGWVTRRDAAEALGKIGHHAFSALQKHKDDADQDVRIAAQKAIALVGNVPSPPPPSDKEIDLRELARACEKPTKRAITMKKGRFSVDVHLADDRHQTVHVMPHKLKDGTRLLKVFTVCGEPETKIMEWAMRSNAKLVRGAFAIHNDGDKEMLLLIDNFRWENITPGEVKAAVKEIAYYGDWLEKKISRLDEF
jgi:hypothetical protein